MMNCWVGVKLQSLIHSHSYNFAFRNLTLLSTFFYSVSLQWFIFNHDVYFFTCTESPIVQSAGFWTHEIPISCLPTLLIFIHIEHICSFFVAFFSATIDGRNLIFGHKLHIGTPYRGMGSVFEPIRFLLPVCRFCWFVYTFNIHLYMHIFQRIFLSNYWWQESDIWSQA